MGILAQVLGVFSSVCLVPAVVAIPFAGLVYVMAGRDLRRMAAGQMDPAGQGATKMARANAVWGLGLALIFPPVMVLGLLFVPRLPLQLPDRVLSYSPFSAVLLGLLATGAVWGLGGIMVWVIHWLAVAHRGEREKPQLLGQRTGHATLVLPEGPRGPPSGDTDTEIQGTCADSPDPTAGNPEMNNICRPARFNLRVSLVFSAFFLAMLIANVMAFYDPSFPLPPDRRLFFSVLIGTFWSTLLGVFLCSLLGYFRESVLWSDLEVRITHVLGTRIIRFDDVVRACWCDSPPGLTLFWQGGREVIPLRFFRPRHRRHLVRFFRQRLALEVQEGWSEAVERFAIDAADKDLEKEEAGLFRNLRWLALAGFLLTVVCGSAFWVVGMYLARNNPGLLPSVNSIFLNQALNVTIFGVAVVVILRVLKWLFRPDHD